MNRQVLQFKDQQEWLSARVGNINSTEAAAMLNLSPYLTRLELYHRLKDRSSITIEETERMKLGKRLESAIAEEAAERNGWKIRPMKDYRFIPDLRIGSSYDYEILEPFNAILECKNVDGIQFKNWEEDEDGNIEATPQIEIQVQHQMIVSGIERAFIAVLVGGNTIKVLERAADDTIQSAILTSAADMWARVDAANPPPIDFNRDAEFLCKLYGYAEPGKILFMENNEEFKLLGHRHREISQQIKELEGRKDALKAEILTIIGDHESVKAGDFSITAGMVGPCEMNYTRSGYRNFRLNWPRRKN